MKRINIFLLIMIAAALLFVLTSCESVAVYHRPGYGPPAHAPAHGFRAKQPHEVVLVDVD